MTEDHAPAKAVPAVDLNGIERRVGRERILSGISLRIAAGRTVVLRGRNGSGKTTLLRILATRLRPSRGTGEIFGHDLVGDAAGVRRHIAYLPTHGGAYGTLTATENLRLAAVFAGHAVAAASLGRASDAVQGDAHAEALRRVGLGDHAHRPVRGFSTGMKRRLGLARLLTSNADLWLLDEPYASLDEEGRDLVDRVLEDAKRAGRTLVVVSHEASRLDAIADATLWIDGGTLSRGARA